MAEVEMITIGSKIPGGLVLHVMERLPHPVGVFDPTPGLMFKDLGLIELAKFNPSLCQESFTSVDKKVWDVWAAENSESSLFKSGAIFVQAPPEEMKVEPEPEPDVFESEPEPDLVPAKSVSKK